MAEEFALEVSVAKDSTLGSKYASNVLIINSKDIVKSDLLDRLLKEGVDKSVKTEDEQLDYETSLLDLTLEGNGSESSATVTLNICATNKRVNHSSGLKDSYRNANSVLFVFNASSR